RAAKTSLRSGSLTNEERLEGFMTAHVVRGLVLSGAPAIRIALLAGSTALTACSTDPTPDGARPPRPDEVPQALPIAGGDVELGFQVGIARTHIAVAGFRVTKTPVTVRQYEMCVAAGACTTPELARETCAIGDAAASSPDVPVTCASPTQAAAYCGWL